MTKEQRDHLEFLELKDQEEMLEKMEKMAGLDHQDKLVLQVKLVCLAFQVQEDSRECQDLLERMELQARMVDPDFRELWE